MSEENTETPNLEAAESTEAVPSSDSAVEAAQAVAGAESSTDGSEDLDAAFDEAEAAVEAGDKKAQAKAEAKIKKIFKLKVDGKEIEEEVDMSDDNYIRNQLQLAKAAQKRMQEYAELKKSYDNDLSAVEQWFQLLAENPHAALQDPHLKSLGIDPRKLADHLMEKELEEEAKSPEQKEREKMQRELEEARKRLEAIEREKKEIEHRRLQDEIAGKVERDIMGAIEAHGLPETPLVIKQMATMLHTATKRGIKLSVDEIAPIVKKQYESDISSQINKMSDEQLAKLVGEERFERARKARVAKAKAAQKAVPKSAKVEDVGNKSTKTAEKKISYNDFFKNLGGL